MKNTFVIITLLTAGMGITANASDAHKLYIIPANAEGKVEKEGAGYKGQIQMVQDPTDENRYTVSNVAVGTEASLSTALMKIVAMLRSTDR